MIPGWRRFHVRAARTWSGVLEPEEVRLAALAFVWLVPVGPGALAAVIVGLAIQGLGAGIALSAIPLAVVAIYSFIAVILWRRNNREAQQLVAHRMGIAERSSRIIDFRGRENFERSVRKARVANSGDKM